MEYKATSPINPMKCLILSNQQPQILHLQMRCMRAFHFSFHSPRNSVKPTYFLSQTLKDSGEKFVLSSFISSLSKMFTETFQSTAEAQHISLLFIVYTQNILKPSACDSPSGCCWGRQSHCNAESPATHTHTKNQQVTSLLLNLLDNGHNKINVWIEKTEKIQIELWLNTNN